jgi:hypothetical protein
MDLNGDGSGLLGIGLLSVGNLLSWMAHTEQIWFPAVGAYVRWIAPAYNLPDLRGPFAFITLLYIGLRIGDLLDKRDEINS